MRFRFGYLLLGVLAAVGWLIACSSGATHGPSEAGTTLSATTADGVTGVASSTQAANTALGTSTATGGNMDPSTSASVSTLTSSSGTASSATTQATPNSSSASATSGGTVGSGGTGTVVTAATNVATATTGGEPVGDPEVRFIGRMDFSDANAPRFAWSGSGIVARFEGTEVSVTLSSGQFTVLIDGQLEPRLVATGVPATLATGLSAGAHTVELYRQTEANLGESQFLGFDFAGGTLLAPPPAPARRIEVVGDSITCGYGVEGADMSCPFSAETENHYLTYAAIAARELNAELIAVAWSGKGAVCNYGDDATSCVDPLPVYYERALPQQANSVWDFQQWQADAVVVNLGTNDFSTTQDPTQQEFEAGYAALLETIRSKYPNAWILCTNGPMLSGTDLSTVRGYIDNVVAAFNGAGDMRVTSFELSPQDPADGYGCDWHPSPATHVKMADQLAAALRSTLGW